MRAEREAECVAETDPLVRTVRHVAGGVASVLSGAGLSEERALRLQRAVESGAVLLGVHAEEGEASAVRKVLEGAGAGDIEVARWEE